MKRIAVVCVTGLALLMGFCLAGAADAADKKVALMWIGKSGMTKRVAGGFLHRMAEIAPTIQVIKKIQLVDELEGERAFNQLEPIVDGVVFLRSTGAKFLARTGSKKPCFVGGCNDPRELGAIKNLDAPEGNITGVTYYIPYEKRFEVIKAMFPGLKSLAMLAEKGHPATPIEQEGTRTQCQRFGIAYHEVIASNAKELQTGMEAIVRKVDLLVSAATRLTIDNMSVQVAIANKNGKAIFSYAAGTTQRGATAELAADDAKLGRMLAESVVDVVVKGKPVKEVPVKMDPDPALVINETMLERLGLKVPDAVLKKAKLVN